MRHEQYRVHAMRKWIPKLFRKAQPERTNLRFEGLERGALREVGEMTMPCAKTDVEI